MIGLNALDGKDWSYDPYPNYPSGRLEISFTEFFNLMYISFSYQADLQVNLSNSELIMSQEPLRGLPGQLEEILMKEILGNVFYAHIKNETYSRWYRMYHD